MTVKKYKVNVHFEGCVDVIIEATDDESAEEMAIERFREMPAVEVLGDHKENVDAKCDADEIKYDPFAER